MGFMDALNSLVEQTIEISDADKGIKCPLLHGNDYISEMVKGQLREDLSQA